MKMAAAEALYETEQPAAFSILTIGSLDGSEEKFSIKLPRVLSFLATGTTDGEVLGINELRDRYEQTYGQDPGEAYYSADGYTPVIPLTYWTFRLMMGLGFAAAAAAAWILWATRKGRTPNGRTLVWVAAALPLMPLFANSFGWIFTEMGRQPWSVFGLMTTARSVSPGVSPGEALVSLVSLTLVYAVLAVVEVKLLLRYIGAGAEPFVEPVTRDDDEDPDRPLAFAY
jgi:cytochrome d ubiquinol oxidase subunit I